MSYSIYVLYSLKYNEIYIGHSRDVEKRLVQHNEGKSNSTKRYIPWHLIHREEFATRSQAMKREKELKSQKGREWIRKEILKKHL